MSKKDRIIIGSCKVYFTEFKGALQDIATIIKDICVEDNIIGYIKGGAEVGYTPTFYEAKDDLGLVSKTTITSEEAVIKTGIMTIDANTLATLSPTARVNVVEDGKFRILKLGGIGNNDGKSYVFVLHHEDKIDGDIYVVVVGKNEQGFTLSFKKDTETIVDAEIKCTSQDSEGTLIQYVEKIPETSESEEGKEPDYEY